VSRRGAEEGDPRKARGAAWDTLALMGPAQRDYVTVVSGLPRSGTSLVMQMLAAGGLPVLADELRQPDAHNPRGYFEYSAVKRLREDASFLAAAVGRAVKVVVPLACALPARLPGGEELGYRVVLVRRELCEVLASQDAMLGGSNPGGLSGSRLAEICSTQLEEFEAWAAGRRRLRLLCVEHAQLLREPRRAAAELSQLVGGGLDLETMAAAVDPALYHRRARD